jgi:hypothetical protein
MNKRNFQDDYNFGKDQEKQLLETMRKQFKDDKIKLSTSDFSPYDFKSKGKRIELKSRFNTYNKYSTTMISLSKTEHAKAYKTGKYYFVFNFTDGLYFIEYEEKQFDTFEIKLCGRNDRNRIEQNKYVMIPIKLLNQI